MPHTAQERLVVHLCEKREMRLGSQSGESLLVVDGEGSGLTLGVSTSSASCGTSGRSFTSVTNSSTSGTASSVTSVTSVRSFTG